MGRLSTQRRQEPEAQALSVVGLGTSPHNKTKNRHLQDDGIGGNNEKK